MTDFPPNPDDPTTKPKPKPRTKASVAGINAGPAAESHAILQGMLTPDEKIIHHVTISPGIYWKGFAVLTIAILLMLLSPVLGLYLAVVSGIMLLIAHLTKHFLLLAATNKRIIMRAGILNLDVIQLRYSKIESVELAWTLIGQFIGYASVVITGTGSRIIIIPFVKDAIAFRNATNEQLIAREESGKTDD